MNHHDKQAHDLIDLPIFPVDKKAGILRSWDELRECEPPKVLRSVDKVMMLCEDNSIWPVSMNADPDPDDRQMSRRDHFEEGFQYAKSSATRAAMGNPLLTAWSVIGCIVFALASVLIALFFIQIKFGDVIADELTAGAALTYFLATFGAIAIPKTASMPRGALKRLRERLSRFWIRLRRKDRPKKVKKEKPPDLGPLETVYIFDELSGRPFVKMVPLYVLTENLPVSCRYTYEPGFTKWIAAGIGAAIGLAAVWGGVVYFYGNIMAIVFGLIFGASFGSIFGYFALPRFIMEPPFWVVRRLRIRTEDGGVDFESMPDIYPEEHTHLMGLPVAEARQLRLVKAHQAAGTAVATAADNGTGIALRERPANSNVTPAMAYIPTVHRATTLYEEIEQRDFKEQFKGGMSGKEKIQVYSLMVMAICSVGLLVFIILITAK